MIVMPLLGSGSEQDLLVNGLGLGTTNSSDQAGPALAELTFTIKTDGTWLFTVGSGDTFSGGSVNGSWLVPSGAAANYEVKFTSSGAIGSPTITNGASTFTAVSSDRSFKIEKNGDNASATMTVELRRIVNPPRTLTNSTTVESNGAA